MIILGERHLRAILKSYLDYYHQSRTHLALGKDAPEPRLVQPPELGCVVELPEVGGLHFTPAVAALFGGEAPVDAWHLIRYFQLRLLWETKRASKLSRADRDFLRAAKKRMTANRSSPPMASGPRRALMMRTLMSFWARG